MRVLPVILLAAAAAGCRSPFGAGAEHHRFLPYRSWARRDGGAGHLALPPFWWDFRGADTAFRMLFPAYGRGRGPGFERTVYEGPLRIPTTDGEETSTDVPFPLARRPAGPDGRSFRALPVLVLDRRETRNRTMVWPLHGLDRHGDRAGHSVAWPLFRRERSGDRREIEVPFPLVRFSGGGAIEESWVFPPVHRRVGPDRSSGRVLLLGATWEDTAERGRFRVPWRPVDAGRTGDRRHFALNPLFRVESNDRGDRHRSAPFGLLARTTEGGESRWRILRFL